MNKFRELRADEIETRLQGQYPNGIILLLYKDARCDMNILDETVGPSYWQRRHYDCKGNLFCSVGILDEMRNEWIWKDDAGAESRTEKEKGEASDSFKRACTNWGIGRELYTSPFIWISEKDGDGDRNYQIKEKDGKVNDNFTVTKIAYQDGKINFLRIKNKKNKEIYVFGTEPSPICPKCNNPVKAGNRKDGTQMTPQEVLGEYGMCAACLKKEHSET